MSVLLNLDQSSPNANTISIFREAAPPSREKCDRGKYSGKGSDLEQPKTLSLWSMRSPVHPVEL